MTEMYCLYAEDVKDNWSEIWGFFDTLDKAEDARSKLKDHYYEESDYYMETHIKSIKINELRPFTLGFLEMRIDTFRI